MTAHSACGPSKAQQMVSESISLNNFSPPLRPTSEPNIKRWSERLFLFLSLAFEHSFGFIFYESNTRRNADCHKKLIRDGFKGNKMIKWMCMLQHFATAERRKMLGEREPGRSTKRHTIKANMLQERFWFLMTLYCHITSSWNSERNKRQVEMRGRKKSPRMFHVRNSTKNEIRRTVIVVFLHHFTEYLSRKLYFTWNESISTSR